MRPEGAAAAVWWRFYQTATVLRRVLENAIVPTGVSLAQAQQLLLLHTDMAFRSQPITQLARTLHVAPEGMSMLVNLLNSTCAVFASGKARSLQECHIPGGRNSEDSLSRRARHDARKMSSRP